MKNRPEILSIISKCVNVTGISYLNIYNLINDPEIPEKSQKFRCTDQRVSNEMK